MLQKSIALACLLLSFSVNAGPGDCSPSEASCDFYRCLEDSVQCGSRGYIERFAQPLCERYRAHEPFASAKLRAWYPRVRKCLQEALVNLDGVESCEALQEKALASHSDCYFETGFCELDWADRFEIGRLAGRSLFMRSVLEQSFRVLERCQFEK